MQETGLQTIPSETHAPASGPVLTIQSGLRARVVAVIVTWNRREMVANVLRALTPQIRACKELHVVVIDNASTDGTTEHLAKTFGPDCIVDNDTRAALEPRFRDRLRIDHTINTPGFASLTIVRNAHNLGGCGGFNTGFMFTKHRFADAGDQPDFVWLLDDDIDLPAEALTRLLSAASSDPDISLVGSRTVDLSDRKTTIESTIYFDARTGLMAPEPADGHPLAEGYREWAGAARDERGRAVYSGVRDVDIVSACSLLARWSDVQEIGYWDDRFFIYCDDADWCLRFRARGKRVVCSMDAIVFHTPWTHKLTPQRGYYINRNMAWMIEKNVASPGRRRARLRWSGQLLRRARGAILCRRLHEAELLLAAVSDSMHGVGGKLSDPAPAMTSVLDALHQTRALGGFGEVVLVCPTHAAKEAAENFRAHVMRELIHAGRTKDLPRWTMLVSRSASAPRHGGEPPLVGPYRPEIVLYRRKLTDAVTRQLRWLRTPPRAVVVFDRASNYPLLRGRWTLHALDGENARVLVERDGLARKLALGIRWVGIGFRSVWHAWRLPPARP